jgi:hypothetical protein
VRQTRGAHIGRAFYPLLLALLTGAGRTAAAQVNPWDRLDPATRTALRPMIDSAAASGLPTRPLVTKALEGTAKHADVQRIVAAVRSLSTDLTIARNALGANAAEAALMAGVGALRAGVTDAYLREIRGIRGAPAIAWPLVVLADLVGRGVPVDTAASLVLSLARAGAADRAYAGLQEQLRREPRRPDSSPRLPGSPSPARTARPDGMRHP